jgi:L-2-hydroxyglutarate oxidase LhgO
VVPDQHVQVSFVDALRAQFRLHKIVPAGAPDADFVIQGPAVHGVPGLVNLFGIESPGLTASLALAEEVRGLLLQ